jgi:2-dehydro-3-deoxygluconokinase
MSGPGAVVTLGETMGLMRAASIGSLEHVSDLQLHIGGAESNVAIGVARLGRAATWMGRVGDDGIGRRVLRELRAEGVSLHATVDESARTGLMLKETPTAGSTRVLYYRTGSAGSRLNAADLDLTAIASAGILHVTGITLALSDSAEHAVHAAVDAAVAAGVPVSFDVNHRPSLWGARDAAPVYRQIAERAAIVFAGDDEARLLVGPGSPEDLAATLAALGPAQAIVKLGERGSVASIDGELLIAAAEPITPLDTVGAGDAFVAGYLVALLDGLPAAARLEQGSRCGAFACLGPGDWESLPRRADLDVFGSGDPVIR